MTHQQKTQSTLLDFIQKIWGSSPSQHWQAKVYSDLLEISYQPGGQLATWLPESRLRKWSHPPSQVKRRNLNNINHEHNEHKLENIKNILTVRVVWVHLLYVSKNDDRKFQVVKVKISPLSASKMPQLEARSRQRRSCDTRTVSF